MFRFSTNVQELMRQINAVSPEVHTAVLRAIKRWMIVTEGKVKSRADLKWRRGSAGLRGRLAHHVTQSAATGIDAVIGFRRTRGFPYELSQELGAKAKPGKAMAMPLTSKAAAAGSPLKFPGKLFIPKGTHVLAEAPPKTGKGSKGSFTPQYALIKRLQPRLNFRKTVHGEFPALDAELALVSRMAFRRT